MANQMPNTTSNTRNLRALLESTDIDVVRETVETLLQLDDVSIYGDLLRSSTWVTHVFRHKDAFGDEAQRLVGSSEFKGAIQQRYVADAAYLRLLAASNLPLKNVDAISIDTGGWLPGGGSVDKPLPLPVDDLSWLVEFPNLQKVQLQGSNITDDLLASLAGVDLDEIVIDTYASGLMMAGHPTIRSLTGRGFGFEEGGSWPHLETVRLGKHGALDPLFDGSPKLTDLAIERTPTNFASGVAYLHRNLDLVRSSTLRRASLHGAYSVRDCPELVELELSGRAAVAGTPSLETLRLGDVSFELDTDPERLARQSGATVELIES